MMLVVSALDLGLWSSKRARTCNSRASSLIMFTSKYCEAGRFMVMVSRLRVLLANRRSVSLFNEAES